MLQVLLEPMPKQAVSHAEVFIPAILCKSKQSSIYIHIYIYVLAPPKIHLERFQSIRLGNAQSFAGAGLGTR